MNVNDVPLQPEPTEVQENVLDNAEKPPYEYRGLTKIGVTRASHEESKKRRKMAAKSRKINRRK